MCPSCRQALVKHGLKGLELRVLEWVLVRGFSLDCHNKETIYFSTDPHDGNLNPENWSLRTSWSLVPGSSLQGRTLNPKPLDRKSPFEDLFFGFRKFGFPASKTIFLKDEAAQVREKIRTSILQKRAS